MTRQPFIIGKTVNLRGVELEDIKKIHMKWLDDSEVTHHMLMGAMPGMSERAEEEYNRLVKSANDAVFVIIDKKSKKSIGTCGLYTINWICRHTEYRILMGETEYHKKGYCKEVTELVLKYAFDKLNLNKVWLGVNAENIGGVKCYTKAGFVEEGTLRKEIYRNGKYYDAIRMSILLEEYNALSR